MPAKISNGVRMYQDALAQLPVGQTLVGGVPTSRNEAIGYLDAFWRGKPDSDQYDFDAMMWYGALTNPGSPAIGTFMTRLFTVLYFAGILYNKSRDKGSHDWHQFAGTIPIASALGHGGRIIIQLPVRTEARNSARAFFDWLVGDVRASGELITRSAATHALAHREKSLPLHGQRRMRLAEMRGKMTGLRGAFKGIYENNHYGVNVPLGGAGNTNPFSGNRIAADGAHGHVYIYYNPKEPGQCGGMMIGCENSAPGATSQTFVTHDFRAISESYSPCGTSKWPNLTSGPNAKAEAMFIDLSDGWSWLRSKVIQFDNSFLDYAPNAVGAGFNPDSQVWALIHAIQDVLANPAYRRHRKFFESTLKRVLKDDVNQALLDEITMTCEQLVRGESFGRSGPRGRRGAICMPPEVAGLQRSAFNFVA